jgi:hypothetical protein
VKLNIALIEENWAKQSKDGLINGFTNTESLMMYCA